MAMGVINKYIRAVVFVGFLLLLIGCGDNNRLDHDSYLKSKDADFDGAVMYVLHQHQITQLEAMTENKAFASLENNINFINVLMSEPLTDINFKQIKLLQTMLQGYQYSPSGWDTVIKDTLLSLTNLDKNNGAALRAKYRLKQYIRHNKDVISNTFESQRQLIAYGKFVSLARLVDVGSDGRFDLPILNNQGDSIIAIVDMTRVKNARYQAIVFKINNKNINTKEMNIGNTQRMNRSLQEIVTKLVIGDLALITNNSDS